MLAEPHSKQLRPLEGKDEYCRHLQMNTDSARPHSSRRQPASMEVQGSYAGADPEKKEMGGGGGRGGGEGLWLL